MRRQYSIILLLLLFCFVSCLKDEKMATSPHAAITSFTIGYYRVKVHDMTWQGHDTVAYIRDNGTNYPMTIDQINNRIYNVDSLAYGSEVGRVTTSVYGTGTVVYYYADEPDLVYAWNSTDSIDFTRELYFGAVSTDESYIRYYQVNLNVHKVFPDSLIWHGPETAGFPALTGISAVVKGDSVFCFGIDTTGAVSFSGRHISEGGWNGSNHISGFQAADWQHRVTVSGGRFHTVSGGTLYCSDNGLDWSSERTGVSGILTSGTDNGVLWAISQDGNIIRTEDFSEWEQVQSVPQHFPDSAAYIFTYPLATNANLFRSVIVGLTDTLYVSVWTMLTGDTVLTEVDLPARKELCLPSVSGLSVFRYDGALFSAGRGLSGFRQSNDNGVTWYSCKAYAEDYASWNRYMQLPAGLDKNGPEFAAVADRNGYIWIMTEDGRVWHGAITRLVKH